MEAQHDDVLAKYHAMMRDRWPRFCEPGMPNAFTEDAIVSALATFSGHDVTEGQVLLDYYLAALDAAHELIDASTALCLQWQTSALGRDVMQRADQIQCAAPGRPRAECEVQAFRVAVNHNEAAVCDWLSKFTALSGLNL